jgi:hypothetical protein
LVVSVKCWICVTRFARLRMIQDGVFFRRVVIPLAEILVF